MAEANESAVAEPAPTPAAAAEPKFKIVSQGTHSTLGASETTDTPPSSSGPAEPANPGTEKTATDDTPPAEQTTGEPPKVYAAKIGGKPQATSNEIPPATAQPTATTATTPPSLEEILKGQGFDEQFINLAKVYKQEGNISRYAQAMSTDFTKMPAEDVHRINIQREYPEATPDQLELLFEEVRDKYKLDPDKFDLDSKEAKAGLVRMEMDAKKLRDKFTQENESLKLPSRDVTAEVQQQQQEAAQKRQEAHVALLNHPLSKSILTDKKMVLRDLSIKDETGKVVSQIPDFTMELEDPNEVRDFLTNPDVYKKYMVGADGKPDPDAHWQLGLFATNRIAYNQAMINYGKMLGKEELVEGASNPPRQTGTPASPVKESLNEAFGKRGVNGKQGG